jgi:hypothetical protein
MSATFRKSRPPVSLLERKRVPVACVQCRQRKVRCQGGIPCNRCVKYSIGCDVNQAQARGRSRMGEGGNNEYIRRLERIVRTAYPEFVDMESLEGIERRLFEQNPSTGSKNYGSRSVSEASVIQTIQNYVTGEVSNNETSEFHPRYATPNDESYPEWKTVVERSLTALPSRERAGFLVHVFQKHCETNYCYVHPVKIRDVVAWAYESTSMVYRDVGKLICLFGVMAIGSQFAYLENDPDDLSTDEEPGQSYYNAALPLLGYLFHSDTFETIQALLILGVYLLPRGNIDAERSYVYLSLATKLGLDNGFYDNQDGGHSEGAALKNRVCWTVYVIERKLALQLDKSDVVPSDRLNLPLPKDNFPGLTYNGESNVFNQRAIIWLEKTLYPRIMQLVYTGRDLYDTNLKKEVDNLFADLNGWKVDVDNHTDLANTSSRMFRGNMHLHMGYYLAVIYLCRPFMLCRLQNTNGRVLTEFFEEMTKRCVQAAIQLVTLLQFMDSVNVLGRYSGTDLIFCVQPIYVLLANNILNGRSESCDEAIQGALLCLRKLTGKGAKAAYDLITNLEQLVERSWTSTVTEFNFQNDIFNYHSFEQWADDIFAQFINEEL